MKFNERCAPQCDLGMFKDSGVCLDVFSIETRCS
jgi:hypothetical protein